MKHSMSSDLGSLLRAARKRAGNKSLYRLREETGFSAGHLSQIEAGKVSPTITTLDRICDAIGLDMTITFRPARKRRK